MSFKRPNRLAVIQALVTGVLILLFCVPTIASAFCVCPRTGVVTLPEPAPGEREVTSFQSYMRQPWVKPAWMPSHWNTRPTRYSWSIDWMRSFSRYSFWPRWYVVVPGPW